MKFLTFRFLNIPVHISPTFWIFLIFFADLYRKISIENLLLGVVAFLSLLIHEYGHAITALRFGARPEIVLEAFGGYAQYDGRNMTPKQQFLITLNGPLLESVLIAVSYFLLKSHLFDHYYIRYFLQATFYINTFWCLFNLIPIIPLDGGKLILYFLERRFGEKGYRLSIVIGLIVSILIAPVLFFYHFYFFGTLLLIFSFQNYQMLKRPRVWTNSHHLFRYLNLGMEALNKNDTKTAKAILNKLLKCHEASIKNSATQALARIYLQEGKKEKSYELLLNADPQLLKEGKCLLCKLAFEHQNYELVGRYSQDIYAIDSSYETALLNSKAFAHLNYPKHAGAWLETAFQFENSSEEGLKTLIDQPTYDHVRSQQPFKDFIEKINARWNIS